MKENAAAGRVETRRRRGPEIDLQLAKSTRSAPRYFQRGSFHRIGLVDDSWPPQNELGRFFPIWLGRPRWLQHKDGQSKLANRPTLRAILLAKCIAGNDAPVLFSTQRFKPCKVLRVGGESFAQLDNFLQRRACKSTSARGAHRGGPGGRQIVVKQEIQWVLCFRLDSNRTAARTNLCGTS